MSLVPEEMAVLLEKARRDLRVAGHSLADPDVADLVCFHAQQAVEKCLKALLVMHGVRYPHRHDLDELLRLLPVPVPELAALADEIETLTPFATTERYENVLRPTPDEARQAVALADTVLDIVRQTIADCTGAQAQEE